MAVSPLMQGLAGGFPQQFPPLLVLSRILLFQTMLSLSHVPLYYMTPRNNNTHVGSCDITLHNTRLHYIIHRIIQGCAEIWNLFRVLTRISHKWAKRTSKISCSTLEIISDFQPSMYCSVYYIKKIVLLPHKNRAVNSNAFHDNRHMWDYHE